MAKNKRPTAGEMEDGFKEGIAERALQKDGKDVKFRSYKNDGSGFDELKEGEQITGVLVSIRDHQITDQRTRQPKEIRVYMVRTDEGTLKISGRTILDRLVDDVMDEQGGFTVDNRRYSGQGYDWLCKRVVRFIRGDDTKTGQGNPLGTYEILVEE